MKARVKYYPSIFDACNDENGYSVTMYGNSRSDILKAVYALSDMYVVSNVYIDESENKEQTAN